MFKYMFCDKVPDVIRRKCETGMKLPCPISTTNDHKYGH